MKLFRLKGVVYPKEQNEKFHFVEVEELDVTTQSSSMKDGPKMAIDAIETLFEGEDFDIVFDGFDPDEDGAFYLVSHNPGPILGRLLKNIRVENGLTISDVAREMGSNSPNSYAQYEQGKSFPSVGKLEQMIQILTKGRRGVYVSFPKINKKSKIKKAS